MQYALQGTLLGSLEPSIDATFSGTDRVQLDGDAWVEHVRGLVAGADALFEDLLQRLEWHGRRIRMYDKVLDEPRLHGSLELGVRPPIVEEMRVALGARYGVPFTSVRANLYRDGRDSVAWHGDRIARDLPEALVGVLSLGGRRRFLLRPKGGGRSVRFEPGSGDLVVMGGSCQRTWQHCVPKMAVAPPRISVTFRHAYE
ncbi:MAG TPA: alpha-ketoglutarate-dependent dioxygenase AlkB [Acidimicrobiales bacterium]